MVLSGYAKPLVVITMALAVHVSVLTGISEAEPMRVCEGAVVRNLGATQCETVLKICVEGVVYRTPNMDEDRLIRWQDVTAWKYFGPRGTERDVGPRAYASLQIWERRGLKHRFNIGCSTSADGHIVFQSMKRYDPRGMIF